MKGSTAAEAGHIVTFGVQPERAATEYGYISPGEIISGKVRAVAKFVEKPDHATAERYIAEGYLWNSGNFLFQASVMQAELEHFQPDIMTAVRDALDNAAVDLDFILKLDADHFAAAPKISIDYAVMERTDHAGVVPLSCGWSDVGTWGSVWQASDQDEAGNAVRGRVRLLDTSNSLVQSEDMLTCVVGLDDVVVVTTQDAVLVTSRERSGEVKALVAGMQTEASR